MKSTTIVIACSFAVFVLATSASWAVPVYIQNNAASVGIVDQHPLARGEQRYDTFPATGIYNRPVDVVGLFYDVYDDYLVLTNGGMYCTPTSALSLVHYWDTWDGPDADNLPDYPNLFDPLLGDTDRSVILALAELMDTDDWAFYGGMDPIELHVGTRDIDILGGLLTYFNSIYPRTFLGREFSLAGAGGGAAGIAAFGNRYDQLIGANIPLILSFPGHSTVGIGFDAAFLANNPLHYWVNDPWNGAANISGLQVGLGRPDLGDAVFGGLVSELYGSDADIYKEYPDYPAVSSPVYMAWIQPVPEPASVLLLGAGLGIIGLVALCRRG